MCHWSPNYQENLIQQFLNDISARYDRKSGDASYDISTLTLRPGASGYTLDVNAAIPLVEAALKSPTNRVCHVALYFIEHQCGQYWHTAKDD